MIEGEEEEEKEEKEEKEKEEEEEELQLLIHKSYRDDSNEENRRFFGQASIFHFRPQHYSKWL